MVLLDLTMAFIIFIVAMQPILQVFKQLNLNILEIQAPHPTNMQYHSEIYIMRDSSLALAQRATMFSANNQFMAG